MSAQQYLERSAEIIGKIRDTQGGKIQAAGELFTASIVDGGRVYLFGSGHSVTPVLAMSRRTHTHDWNHIIAAPEHVDAADREGPPLHSSPVAILHAGPSFKGNTWH